MPSKRTPAQIWKDLEKEAREDEEIEKLASLSNDALDAELAAGGFDVEKEKAEARAVVEELERSVVARRAKQVEAKGRVRSLKPPPPQRPLVWWVVAATVGAAAAGRARVRPDASERAAADAARPVRAVRAGSGASFAAPHRGVGAAGPCLRRVRGAALGRVHRALRRREAARSGGGRGAGGASGPGQGAPRAGTQALKPAPPRMARVVDDALSWRRRMDEQLEVHRALARRAATLSGVGGPPQSRVVRSTSCSSAIRSSPPASAIFFHHETRGAARNTASSRR